jgi:hypothetical protein
VNSDKRVIAACALIAVAVGSGNAIVKDKRLPSTRFLIGSGVAFLILSALSDMGEAGAEIGKGLAAGIMTTVVLGDGGGLLSYIDHGEVDTQKKKGKGAPAPPSRQEVVVVPGHRPGGTFRPDTLPSFPGLTATPPVVSGPSGPLANYPH